jgi:hypothetical protein
LPVAEKSANCPQFATQRDRQRELEQQRIESVALAEKVAEFIVHIAVSIDIDGLGKLVGLEGDLVELALARLKLGDVLFDFVEGFDLGLAQRGEGYGHFILVVDGDFFFTDAAKQGEAWSGHFLSWRDDFRFRLSGLLIDVVAPAAVQLPRCVPRQGAAVWATLDLRIRPRFQGNDVAIGEFGSRKTKPKLLPQPANRHEPPVLQVKIARVPDNVRRDFGRRRNGWGWQVSRHGQGWAQSSTSCGNHVSGRRE